jgi:hypothetical protein
LKTQARGGGFGNQKKPKKNQSGTPEPPGRK